MAKNEDKLARWRNSLKRANRYSEELEPQLEIVVTLSDIIDAMKEEMLKPGYTHIVSVINQYGEKKDINPNDTLFLNYIKTYQTALRALGVNQDSRQGLKTAGETGNVLASLMEDNENDD